MLAWIEGHALPLISTFWEMQQSSSAFSASLQWVGQARYMSYVEVLQVKPLTPVGFNHKASQVLAFGSLDAKLNHFFATGVGTKCCLAPMARLPLFLFV